MPDSPRFAVRFDEEAFTEDMHHASPAGRRIARNEHERLERDGVAAHELRACQAEGRDGTRLRGCVKTYLPQPDGPWGMVFTGDRDDDGNPVLVCLAFGFRHPLRPWQPSVYQVAHRRLHQAAGSSGDEPCMPRGAHHEPPTPRHRHGALRTALRPDRQQQPVA